MKEIKPKNKKEYCVIVHGIPDFLHIPKNVLEPIVNKILENILDESKEKSEE